MNYIDKAGNIYKFTKKEISDLQRQNIFHCKYYCYGFYYDTGSNKIWLRRKLNKFSFYLYHLINRFSSECIKNFKVTMFINSINSYIFWRL